MASKVSDLLKVIGRNKYEAGAHMYHAATGVSDGNFANKWKREKIKKAFARYRGFKNKDEQTHHYGADQLHQTYAKK